jgi:hypothetical protein
VSFSRKHTNKPTKLFGSAIETNTIIGMRLHIGEQDRAYSKNRYFGRQLLAEVDMTPNQFSELITTMNVGEGIPVTIRYFNGEDIPHIPEDKGVDKKQKTGI